MNRIAYCLLALSRSGVYYAAAAESEGMAQGRPARGSHAPGTHYYNNWDFNVAGRILERATGRRIYDDFHEEIAKPLGMLDYRNRIVIPDSDGPPGGAMGCLASSCNAGKGSMNCDNPFSYG